MSREFGYDKSNERETICGETDIVHQITSVGGEARKISQGKSDGRAARDRRVRERKLRARISRRTDTWKPTIRHHKAQVGNHARTTASEQHGLSLEARAIQKLRLDWRSSQNQREPNAANKIKRYQYNSPKNCR